MPIFSLWEKGGGGDEEGTRVAEGGRGKGGAGMRNNAQSGGGAGLEEAPFPSPHSGA